MQYNEIIRKLREEKELNQEDIAKKLKTTYQYYSGYERGVRKVPLERMIELADFYKVSLDYICGRSKRKTYEATDEICMDKKEFTPEQIKALEIFIEALKVKNGKQIAGK